MEKSEEDSKLATSDNTDSSKESNSAKGKSKNRGKKRKRRSSGSSSEYETVLPDNSLEVDRSLYATAIKNNLDETSVRKIIKKVVTNDRVLALVKMREEEDSGLEESSPKPKLTRAKVKELMKVSPATWNLEKLELTPIKHIPVKTRPEVKALIAQELHEDEDDEEYEPTHDDVPSDDDLGLESCSDLDSQPRTPATPRSLHSASPRVVKDGPFKVPQDLSTPTRRKLELEEDATIALRTRSKLSLSSTSIEHIESTFIPPDDIPPAVDDIWNEFLNECMNPASMSKAEDDDETDPEYNVAADQDAHDEDEESLGNSIIKISKKELNDLVTELFSIIPEATGDEDLMANDLANSVLTNHSQSEVSNRWEGKQEQLSDDENGNRQKLSDRITFEKKNYSSVSIGKTEPMDLDEERASKTPVREKDGNMETNNPTLEAKKVSPIVRVVVEEQVTSPAALQKAPPLLQRHLSAPSAHTECVHIQVDQATAVLPQQIQILQQQLRQHVQLATSSYLQLYVHPVHWSYAHTYKEFLDTFMKLAESNPKSVAKVCNLKPAFELITTWEKTVSENTPGNREMITFIQKEVDRCTRRNQNKNLYVGEFHETFKKVVANSPVFLYPYLLPPMPFRGDTPRRFCYLHSEDELIALGLDQFWQYVSDNPSLYKPRSQPHPRRRWGLNATLELVAKYMFPWLTYKMIFNHVQCVRKHKDKENPIYKYFETFVVDPVQHKLLPYNPKLSLYEQPEHEVPRIWVRYLAKTSKRFRSYLLKRSKTTGMPPQGVDIELGQEVIEPTTKTPLSIDFTKQIVCNRFEPKPPEPTLTDKFDIQITNNIQATPPVVTNLYKLVETSTGAYLLPLTMTVNSNSDPIMTTAELHSEIIANLPENKKTTQEKVVNMEHCTCCILLRKICKQRQTVITDFFGRNNKSKPCGCKEKRYPKVSNRLKLLVNHYKNNYMCALQTLKMKLKLLEKDDKRLSERNDCDISNSDNDLDDLAFVTKFHLKLLTRTSIAKTIYTKKKVHTLLSRFNPYEHDPLKLAADLDKAFGHDLVDMYKEFLGFLTPEQVDKVDAFRDYFIRHCVMDLVKKIEEQVLEKENRHKILKELHKVFSKNLATACEICTDILTTLDGYPKLAEYVHSLFPHRKDKSPDQKTVTAVPIPKPEPLPATEKPLDETAPCEDTTMMDSTTEYEADQSMSEEENTSESKNNSDSESNPDGDQPIKTENTSNEDVTPSEGHHGLVITVSKTEIQDFSDNSNTSLKIMFDDEMVKIEAPDWKRDEDKIILEVLKEHLTPEEREDKTILEIIDEKNIVNIISESLSDKSKSDIRTRILYLLQIC